MNIPKLPKGFDPAYYYAANPDVAKAAEKAHGGLTVQFAQTHYQNYGAKEGRKLAPTIKNFNASQYLAANPDVKKMGMDPTLHYHRYGQKEGRKLYTDAFVAKKQAEAAAARQAEIGRLQAIADRKEMVYGKANEFRQQQDMRPSFNFQSAFSRGLPPIQFPSFSAPPVANRPQQSKASASTIDAIKAQNRATRQAPPAPRPAPRMKPMAPPAQMRKPPAPDPFRPPQIQQIVGASRPTALDAKFAQQAQRPVFMPKPVSKLGVESLFDLYKMK